MFQTMSHFLRETVRRHGAITRARCFSAIPHPDESFTVSYLMNSLGFSETSASSISKHVSFESDEKPEKNIEFFSDYGLTLAQIRALVKKYPRILLSDTVKTISPKLEYLRAKGLSRHELGSMISKFPRLIKSGLSSQIVPSYDFWRRIFGSDEKAVMAVKRSPDLLTYNLENNVSPNVESLKRRGTPVDNIFRLAIYWPMIVSRSPFEFEKAVEVASEMGFNHVSKTKFVKATVAILLGMRESRWESKVEAYKKFGWSEQDFLVAFAKNPTCMFLSLENISASMNFFVTEMGVNPSFLAKWPSVVCYSLKRARLRCSVYRALLSKGLMKRDDLDVVRLVLCTEDKFLGWYLKPYVDEYPELLDLYLREEV